MSGVARGAAIFAIVLVVAACSSGPPPAPSASASAEAAAPSVVPTPLVTPVASVAATPAASPTTFTSPRYGYSLALPGAWNTTEASQAWDGSGAPSNDAPEVDQFQSLDGTVFAYAAPTPKDLTAYVEERNAGTLAVHGNTCPDPPERQEPIEVGGEPGTLVSWNCGILINGAYTVHDGVGYAFMMRDPAVAAATDPADRALLGEILDSVKFP